MTGTARTRSTFNFIKRYNLIRRNRAQARRSDLEVSGVGGEKNKVRYFTRCPLRFQPHV